MMADKLSGGQAADDGSQLRNRLVNGNSKRTGRYSKEIKDRMKLLEHSDQDDCSEDLANQSSCKEDYATEHINANPVKRRLIHDVDKPLAIRFELNIYAWSLFIVALAFRLWRLDHPHSVVFDELHYGRFVSMYVRGIFFFDSQPPLGKQIIAATAYLAGFDGVTNFTGIGMPYSDNVPLKALRLIPALCGSLLVPVVYHIVIELGYRHRTAALAALFVILENSFLTQSKFLLMDMLQITLSMSGLWAALKSRRQERLSLEWHSWILLSVTFLSLGVCVRYAGVYTHLLVFSLVVYDFWLLIPNKAIKTATLWLQSLYFALYFVAVPLFIYLFVFYVHLSWLTKAGPHDNILTSAFQASLEGGLASITKGQPLEIVHGSQVTLRHTHGRTCWLHSHAQVYPVRYTDGRGSSHQQQITCYSFKDVNNWWIVKKPELNELVVTEPLQRIKDGDVIQLIHGITGRSLNSHDVAAPVSPHSQEVSCYVDYNISMPSQNLWKVQLLNPDETDGVWHTIRSTINLIHLNSSQALKFSGKQLPDWGFNQHEIVTDRMIHQDDTVWNVEEHRYTKSSDEKQRERDLVTAEFVPTNPTRLTFWEKMKELQYKMLIGSNDQVEGHMYENESPLSWLTMTQGIAYWIAPDSNAQIYLIGNLYLWYASLMAVVINLTLFIYYLLRRTRQCYGDTTESLWQRQSLTLRVTFAGYLVNLMPYFFMERSLFLHHYLPSVVFKLILLAALFEHVTNVLDMHFTFKLSSVGRTTLVSLVHLMPLILFAYSFVKLLPLSYATYPLTAADVQRMKWKETWQLIVHKS
ncbi:Protein O-mannosyltransferase 1 [Halotydeus destructor]|nr:Protein O-mannosyltransferase 1 [Halotydeus destructor]